MTTHSLYKALLSSCTLSLLDSQASAVSLLLSQTQSESFLPSQRDSSKKQEYDTTDYGPLIFVAKVLSTKWESYTDALIAECLSAGWLWSSHIGGALIRSWNPRATSHHLSIARWAHKLSGRPLPTLCKFLEHKKHWKLHWIWRSSNSV